DDDDDDDTVGDDDDSAPLEQEEGCSCSQKGPVSDSTPWLAALLLGLLGLRRRSARHA
ncbi:MAG TPA: hypothetical protein DIU15_00035, partial [Deltaproteobacteria bacterium]|nr:hypothetical protein [Deltaproteobacteria bacterium]